MRNGFLAATLGVVATALIVISAGAAAETAGTWAQYPAGATEYQAEVQQPINSANTSNWSAKSKGGIPVMYKLFQGTGPAVFESIYNDPSTANDFAFASFTPSGSLTFNEIETLSANYDFTLGDCHGGSLRWSVRTSATQSVFIYYGNPSEFGNGGVGGCTPTSPGGVNQSGTNMIGLADLRYDTSQYAGGDFYDTYAHAQTLVGTTPVIRVSLVLDSGWGGNQRATVSNITVNNNVYQWDDGGTGELAPTCDLPDAFIDVTRIDLAPDGVVNETTVYPTAATDTSKQFRVVDCKYQYVLSIPSLEGSGTYDVEILIGGDPVDTSPNSEVRFDLK